MKVIIIDENREKAFLSLASMASLPIYDNPLEAFAAQEAKLCVDNYKKETGAKLPFLEDIEPKVERELKEYLLNSEEAMDYSGFDDITTEQVIAYEKVLWDEFKSLPIDEKEETILTSWRHFAAGSYIDDIKTWFVISFMIDPELQFES